jgi:phosphoribosylpyrophosphate synthetase
MTLVGEVEGMIAVLVDDMADTCGTLVCRHPTLKEAARKVVRGAHHDDSKETRMQIQSHFGSSRKSSEVQDGV